MKNLKFNYKILLSALVIMVGFNSCQESDNVIDQVVAGTTNGAVLRTIEVISNTLNSSDPTSSWGVTVEEQDTEDGALLASVDVRVSIRDLTPDNGTTVADDFFIKSIDASEFSTGPQGLPRATIMATFAEAEAAMGLNNTQHAPGDLFVFGLTLNLTDGRSFTNTAAGGIITGGFFASPYVYNAGIICTPEPGDYTVDMFDTYGDGWQTNGGNGGDGITVTLTDGSGNVSVVEFGMCTPYGDGSFLDVGACTPCPAGISCTADFTSASTTVTIPAGTATAIWEFPGDRYGEISFDIYAPDGTLLLAVGTGEGVPGLLPVTNCL
jgi:hypothetical protein